MDSVAAMSFLLFSGFSLLASPGYTVSTLSQDSTKLQVQKYKRKYILIYMNFSLVLFVSNNKWGLH